MIVRQREVSVIMRIIAFAIAMLMMNVATAADEAQATVAERQAQFANQLFIDACLAHLGDRKAIVRWARKQGLGRTAPDFARATLQDEPGEVWSAANDVGEFVVLVKANGNCEVWARRADAKAATRIFEAGLQGATRPGQTVARVDQREIQAQGITYSQVGWHLKLDGQKYGWVLIAITTDSADAEVQVRLSADRTR